MQVLALCESLNRLSTENSRDSDVNAGKQVGVLILTDRTMGSTSVLWVMKIFVRFKVRQPDREVRGGTPTTATLCGVVVSKVMMRHQMDKPHSRQFHRECDVACRMTSGCIYARFVQRQDTTLPKSICGFEIHIVLQ